jgi:GNAT superfamily N-acetyltransferase
VALILSLVNELAVYERAEPGAVTATLESLHAALFPPAGPALTDAFIAELDGQPQGFALCFTNFSSWVGRPGLYLEDLFVRPSARGLGLGKALLIEVARLAVARNCKRLDWVVLDWNTPAIDFYKSLGASSMDEWTGFRLSGDALARLAATPQA